jgi:hypothetical protein
VQVSGYTSLDVTVSFPSLLALRSFFSSSPRSCTGPELDERFVMSSNHAARILRRRVAEEELAGDVMHQDSFWLVKPCLYDFSASSPHDVLTPSPPPATAQAKAPAASSCLLDTLKCDGAGWGVRRRVRYIGRHHDASKEASAASLDGYNTEVSVQEEQQQRLRLRLRLRQRREQEDNKSTSNGKRKREEAESSMDKSRAARKKKAKTYKSPKKVEKRRVVEAKDGDPRRGKDRWSAERYAAAERSLLDIMRSHGARFGAPVMRQALREEARKHIGDTGLLDHLLKHMAGRVPEGSADRFRRRHNADGAMEYWLEPAELAEVRRLAGVSDPYWVPPPGWKPGDDVSAVAGDLLVKKKVEELAEEVDGVKRSPFSRFFAASTSCLEKYQHFCQFYEFCAKFHLGWWCEGTSSSSVLIWCSWRRKQNLRQSDLTALGRYIAHQSCRLFPLHPFSFCLLLLLLKKAGMFFCLPVVT